MILRASPRLTRSQIGFLCLCTFVLLDSLPAPCTQLFAVVSAQPGPSTPTPLGSPTTPISSPTTVEAPSALPPSDAPSSSPPNNSIPIESPEPVGLTSCIGSAPLPGAFYCADNGYWVLDADLTVGSGGLLKTMLITGPTLVMGTVTVKEDGKVTILLPLADSNFPRLDYAMLRSTDCITLGGDLDIQATVPAIKAANESTLQNREYFLFDSPGCDVFLGKAADLLPYNDTLADKHLPRCAVVKARIDLVNDSLPAFDNSTEIQGNASRRFISAYVTWYHDCLGFYTKVLIPSIFGALLAIVLLVLVPMVFYTPKCCLDAKEREYRKKRKARHEEERKAMLRENRGSGEMTSDEDYAAASYYDDTANETEDVEKGTKGGSKKANKDKIDQEVAGDAAGSDGAKTQEKKKKKWSPKAILTAPAILLPGRHYHADKDAAKNKPKKKVTIQGHNPAKRAARPQAGPRRPIPRDTGKDDDDYDDVDDHDESQAVQMTAIPTVHSHESDFDSESSSQNDSLETRRQRQEEEDYEDERDEHEAL